VEETEQIMEAEIQFGPNQNSYPVSVKFYGDITETHGSITIGKSNLIITKPIPSYNPYALAVII
jgi:hypothetical protein